MAHTSKAVLVTRLVLFLVSLLTKVFCRNDDEADNKAREYQDGHRVHAGAALLEKAKDQPVVSLECP